MGVIYKSFSQFVESTQKEIVVTFGRFNPPTIGHGILLAKVAAVAASEHAAAYHIYSSQSEDSKKNPLEYTEKIKILRKMFPKHARAIILDLKIKTILDVAVKLSEEGYTKLHLIVGSDRIAEFTKLLNHYQGVKLQSGRMYKFQDGISITAAGIKRDPDAEGAEGMSASKMRLAAGENDFKSFKLGLPETFSISDSQDLFNLLRKRMGLAEVKSFWQHTELQTVSEVRDRFIRGEIFLVGDKATVIKSGEEVTIVQRGANYVVTESITPDKTTKRRWLIDILPFNNI